MTAAQARGVLARVLAVEEALAAALARVEQLEAAATTRQTIVPAPAAPKAGKGSPRWLTFVRWSKPCATCHTEIPSGPGLAFYEPATKAMYCERHGDDRWVALKAAGQDVGAKPRIPVTA